MITESETDFVTQKRNDALANFSLFDDRAEPLNVSSPEIPIQLKTTSAVIITGYIPGQLTGFAINLTCKLSGYIALHFNPRLDRGYVVRNSKHRGSWEDEETCSPAVPSSCIFRRDAYFHVIIFCGPFDFQISVNGEHFCEFHYREPLETITALQIVGGVEDARTRLTSLWTYPDSDIYKPPRNLSLIENRPLLDDLRVPVTVNVAQEYNYGARIVIKGRLKLLPHSFYVNLQNGETIYPHPKISLHLNPRFLYGNRPACVVMNCWMNGAWSNEERHEGHLSWGPGRDFLLTICCETEGYAIWLGDKMIGEFRHRLQPTVVDTLKISGDVVLHEITMNYA